MDYLDLVKIENEVQRKVNRYIPNYVSLVYCFV